MRKEKKKRKEASKEVRRTTKGWRGCYVNMINVQQRERMKTIWSQYRFTEGKENFSNKKEEEEHKEYDESRLGQKSPHWLDSSVRGCAVVSWNNRIVPYQPWLSYYQYLSFISLAPAMRVEETKKKWQQVYFELRRPSKPHTQPDHKEYKCTSKNRIIRNTSHDVESNAAFREQVDLDWNKTWCYFLEPMTLYVLLLAQMNIIRSEAFSSTH